ncbi:MAG TPA: GNAT family N-acetyltransferase [Sphingomonas sp.]|nr:GNAT family N-acetyltransferase [Sphingomonas sp.]
MVPMLTTQRLTLSAHRPDDLDDCAAMWADPRVYAMIGGQPRAREEVWIRLLRSIGQWAAFGYGAWLIRERDGGRFVGEIGLIEARRAIEPSIDDAPENGWALAGDAHGRGFAGEALAAVLGWTDANGIALTRCIIDPANHVSIRLAERHGYREAVTGRYHDAPILIFARAASAHAGT